MSETPPPPSGDQPPWPQYGQQPNQQPNQQYGQPQYGQPQYGQPPPPPQAPYGAPQVPYGQQPYAGGYPGAVPDHPKATLVLVLGILGVVLCQVLSPFAWIQGNQVLREIDASNGALGGRSSANAGRICGIIGSVLLMLSVLGLFGFVFLSVALAPS